MNEIQNNAKIYIKLHSAEKISAEYMMTDIEILTVSDNGLLPNQDVVLSLGGKEQSLTTGITGQSRNQLVFPVQVNQVGELAAWLRNSTAVSVSYPVVPKNYEEILSVQIQERLSAQLKSKEAEIANVREKFDTEKKQLLGKYVEIEQKFNEIKLNFDKSKETWKTERQNLENKLKETEKLIPVKVRTKYNLRSKPAILEDFSRDIEKIYREYNFWCKDNPQGFFPNDFLKLNEDIVLDKATGLMWQKKATNEFVEGKDAHSHVKKINTQKFAGYNDWRVPTLEEGMSLLQQETIGNSLHLSSHFLHPGTPSSYQFQGFWTSDIESPHWECLILANGKVCVKRAVDICYTNVRACRSITADEKSKFGL